MFPLWLKLICAAFILILVPIYLRQYGAINFLWFSDIALIGTLAALWLENGFLASTMAVSVLLVEWAWNLDFFARLLTGVRLIGLSDYMFDGKINLAIRALSMFHLLLPPLLVWMLYRLGYDERALIASTGLAWFVLPLSRWLSTPAENTNWVYGFGQKRWAFSSAPLHVAVLMIGFPVLVYLPTHFLLKEALN